MKTIRLRALVLGEGRPAVAVPIVGADEDAVLAAARAIIETGAAELVEWRADFCPGVTESGAPQRILRALRGVLGDIPVLFTFRTRAEGGAAELPAEEYVRVCAEAAAEADAVDVQMLGDEAAALRALAAVHAAGTPVVGSWHSFAGTPETAELVRRLRRIQALGADIPKLAVMPHSRADVLALLDATRIMAEQYADRPIITMSMGALGVISRLSGELFGSALTFGAVGAASAPGQIGAAALRDALELFHGCL